MTRKAHPQGKKKITPASRVTCMRKHPKHQRGDSQVAVDSGDSSNALSRRSHPGVEQQPEQVPSPPLQQQQRQSLRAPLTAGAAAPSPLPRWLADPTGLAIGAAFGGLLLVIVVALLHVYKSRRKPDCAPPSLISSETLSYREMPCHAGLSLPCDMMTVDPPSADNMPKVMLPTLLLALALALTHVFLTTARPLLRRDHADHDAAGWRRRGTIRGGGRRSGRRATGSIRTPLAGAALVTVS